MLFVDAMNEDETHRSIAPQQQAGLRSTSPGEALQRDTFERVNVFGGD
jgi:hypothetical protein